MAQSNTDNYFKEIEAILKSGDFTPLVGLKENDNFEAKFQHPYHLNSSDPVKKASAVFEMITDIASIANNSGGYIVFGLDTIHDPSANTDVVTKFTPFNKVDFYTQHEINGILNNNHNVYPSLEVEIIWFPKSDDPSVGLGAIRIPTQASDKKRFIVKTAILGDEVNTNFVGIPVRHGHNKDYLDARQVYLLTKERPADWQESHDRILEEIKDLSNKLQNFAKKPGDNRRNPDPLLLKMVEINHE